MVLMNQFYLFFIANSEDEHFIPQTLDLHITKELIVKPKLQNQFDVGQFWVIRLWNNHYAKWFPTAAE